MWVQEILLLVKFNEEGEDIRNSIAIGEYAMESAEQSRQNTVLEQVH